MGGTVILMSEAKRDQRLVRVIVVIACTILVGLAMVTTAIGTFTKLDFVIQGFATLALTWCVAIYGSSRWGHRRGLFIFAIVCSAWWLLGWFLIGTRLP